MNPVGAALVDEVDPKSVPLPEDVAAFNAKANGQVRMIPLALIRENKVALRGVQRENERYQLLVQSIRQRGVLNSILVREQRDEVGTLTYGLIDGLQRFTASIDAAKTEIPARIVTMDDAELLEAQIITNMTRIETKPAQYSEHLVRILARNPFMTKQQLSERICQSLTWVDERLSLNDLKKEIAELVDNGRINLTNAYALAKIPEEEQTQHVDAAISEEPKTFVPRMKARVKEIREAKKAGKDSSPAVFTPVKYMHKMSDLNTELESKQARDTLLGKLGIAKSTEAQQAWEQALLWVLHFDEDNQKAQHVKNEERIAKRKEEAAKNKIEKQQEKDQKAAEDAVKIDKGW